MYRIAVYCLLLRTAFIARFAWFSNSMQLQFLFWKKKSGRIDCSVNKSRKNEQNMTIKLNKNALAVLYMVCSVCKDRATAAVDWMEANNLWADSFSLYFLIDSLRIYIYSVSTVESAASIANSQPHAWLYRDRRWDFSTFLHRCLCAHFTKCHDDFDWSSLKKKDM